MKKSGKLIAIWSMAVVVATAIAACRGGIMGPTSHASPAMLKAYRAVPADAILIMDFNEAGDCRVFDDAAPLGAFQKRIAAKVGGCHAVVSAHYSAKNEISLLYIIDLQGAQGSERQILNLCADSVAGGARRYNGAKVLTLRSGLNIAIAGGLMIASGSAMCVESSLRHIAGGSSILDDNEFYKVLDENGGGRMFLNHSGLSNRFLMRFATWSALALGPQTETAATFEGPSYNGSDPACFSAIYRTRENVASDAAKILPDSTLFYIAVQFPNPDDYFRAYGDYLAANKRGGLDSKGVTWLTQGGASEAVATLCRINGREEWLTLLYRKASGPRRFVVGVRNHFHHPEVSSFVQKGLIAGVLGKEFARCPEEYSCTIGEWRIIGSRAAVEEFAAGRANAVKLEQYLLDNEVDTELNEKGVAKVFINLKDGGESVRQIVKEYYSEALSGNFRRSGFRYATINVVAEDQRVITKLNFN